MNLNELPKIPEKIARPYPTTIESIGEIQAIFRPGRGNIVAGIILGLILILGGIAFAIFEVLRENPQPLDHGDKLAQYLMVAGFGLGCPIWGIFVLRWMKRLWNHHVGIGENGFAYTERGTTDICLWENVEKIVETITKESLPIVYIPGGDYKSTAQELLIFRKDGKNYRFSVNSVKGITRLSKLVKKITDSRHILWETTSVE